MFSSNTSQTSGGYEIQRSLRFNSADTAFLNRTPASAGNRQTWTWSAWVKRGALSGNNILFSASNASNTQFYINLGSDNTLAVVDWNGATQLTKITTQVFRDASAWYHIVFALDTTQATASNRARLYVNGVEVTAFSTATNPAQNYQGAVNTTAPHSLGRDEYADNNPFDGYMTEVNFIDGQALTPSSFGAFDAQTGVWGPTRYAGSYGTNGFYLNFSDNSNTTAATLGRDYSGNSNNWTPNNFSVSAGAGNDSLVDSPTPYGTDTGVGGNVRGNYATLNPLDKSTNASAVNGNLDVTSTGGAWVGIRATLGMQTGKWYCEYTPTSGTFHVVSVSQPQASTASYIIDSPLAYGYQWDGNKVTNNTPSSYGAGWGVGDIIGIAFDADAGTITFYKNNVSQGVAFSGLTSGPYLVGLGFYPTATGVFNFGQRPFAYTAPSGFKALNTQNLPTPTIGATTATQAGRYFGTALYTGNSGISTITTGIDSASGGLTWIKNRTLSVGHYLTNNVAGYNTYLSTDSTMAQDTFTGFTGTATGFTVNSASNVLNNSSSTYVTWNWLSNGTGVTNTAGSITSTVSANTTSGFSVVTFTASANSGTIGHGLGVAPKFIILKSRNNTSNWVCYHASLGADKYINLDGTAGSVTNTATWQNTTPTSTVFSSNGPFVSGWTEVAYCFAEVPGYSRFGSYTGNGSADGPFVFTGFRPAYVMYKRSDAVGDWVVLDVARDSANVAVRRLFPNVSSEESSTSPEGVDFLSNGFKLRTSFANANASGGTFIFAAFASAPQKFALAR